MMISCSFGVLFLPVWTPHSSLSRFLHACVDVCLLWSIQLYRTEPLRAFYRNQIKTTDVNCKLIATARELELGNAIVSVLREATMRNAILIRSILSTRFLQDLTRTCYNSSQEKPGSIFRPRRGPFFIKHYPIISKLPYLLSISPERG